MCGRFLMDWETPDDPALERLKALTAALEGGEQAARGEVFPTNSAAVLVRGREKADLRLMRWGMELPGGSRQVINARAETAEAKGMFSRCLAERRCVVPTTGFYEWTHDGEKKRFLFRMPEGIMVYLAGLYDEQGRFVVLTTAANDSMRDVHDRMPVILHRGEILSWLFAAEWAHGLLKRPSPELIRISS